MKQLSKKIKTELIHTHKVIKKILNSHVQHPIEEKMLIEFCEKKGRPYISMLDNSCSVFFGQHPYTDRQVAIIDRKIKELGPNIAKGGKIKRRRQKTNRKKTKGRKKLTKRK